MKSWWQLAYLPILFPSRFWPSVMDSIRSHRNLAFFQIQGLLYFTFFLINLTLVPYQTRNAVPLLSIDSLTAFLKLIVYSLIFSLFDSLFVFSIVSTILLGLIFTIRPIPRERAFPLYCGLLYMACLPFALSKIFTFTVAEAFPTLFFVDFFPLFFSGLLFFGFQRATTHLEIPGFQPLKFLALLAPMTLVLTITTMVFWILINALSVLTVSTLFGGI